MKILVNGTSVNIGPDSWTTHLQKKLNCDMVNLSRGYAGNTYMHDSTLAEISERSYDLVIINWTFFGRMDFRTKYPIMPDNAYTLQDPNYHLLQTDWLLGGQPIKEPEVAKIADQLIKYHDTICNDKKVMVPAPLYKLISLQSVLKLQNIPYLFSFHFNTHSSFTRYPKLCDMIDWTNVHDQYFHSIAKDNGWWDPDDGDGHPSSEAHEFYANLILEHLNTKNLIVP